MQLTVHEYFIWHPFIVSLEVENEDFSDFYPKKKRRFTLDLAYACRDHNGLGLTLEAYKCRKCGYICASAFALHRKPKRCRCLTKF